MESDYSNSYELVFKAREQSMEVHLHFERDKIVMQICEVWFLHFVQY